jgi:hypothetical protein
MHKIATAAVACAATLVPVALWLAFAVAPACTPHTCDSAFAVKGDPIHGYIEGGTELKIVSLDPLVWQSQGIEETWIPFRGQQTYQFWLPPEQFGGSTIYSLVPWIGAVDNPNAANQNFAIAPGSLAQFSNVQTDVPLNVLPDSGPGGIGPDGSVTYLLLPDGDVPQVPAGDGGTIPITALPDGGPIPLFLGATFDITNGTCANYFLRVVVQAVPPDASMSDGSSDAGAGDASSDTSGE